MRSTQGWVAHRSAAEGSAPDGSAADGSAAEHAAAGARATLHREAVERRDLRADDVAVRVDYCGVCHSDLHALRDHGGRSAGGDEAAGASAAAAAAADETAEATDGGSSVPLVPGHEFTGVVTEIGPEVQRFAIGDVVAVGNIVDACLVCDMCTAGQENFCREFPTLTYGGVDRRDGRPTLGAYAREYVVREEFAHRVPEGLDPSAAAPLLCAGITVWEPLTALEVGPGVRVAVVGLGGLGHLAVKLATALGAETTVISRSAGKLEDARQLGAADLLVSGDGPAMAAARGRFDVIVDTVAVSHELAPYLELLALDGTLAQVGYLGPVTVETTDLLLGRKKLTSAGSGGMAKTAQLLEFCAEHGVVADVEVLPSSQVGEALDRLARGDVRFRFVLDMSDLDVDPS